VQRKLFSSPGKNRGPDTFFKASPVDLTAGADEDAAEFRCLRHRKLRVRLRDEGCGWQVSIVHCSRLLA
jgi:hypothetical protein